MKEYTFSPSSGKNGMSGSDLTSTTIRNKGPLKLNIDLKQINTGNSDIIRVQLDFADKNNINDNIDRNYIFLNERPNFELPFSHIYFPSQTNSYSALFKPKIILTFSNFNIYTYILDVRLYKESFYTKHGRLRIISGQFVDDVDDSMFLVCNNINGDKFNVVVK
jgi:hypothetical protein